MCYKGALDVVLAEYAGKNPEAMAENSGCFFDKKGSFFVVPYCRKIFKTSYPEGVVMGHDGAEEIWPADRVLILQYLARSIALPPLGEWLSFLDLSGGEHHYTPFQKEVVFPLANRYGNNVAEFIRLSEGLEPVRLSGDAAYIIPVFPRINLAVMLWQGDEDFPPRAGILFDAASPHHLPTGSLYVLGIEAVKRIYPF